VASTSPDPTAGQSSSPSSLHILVVDDDPGLNRLVSAVIRSAGYQVTTADGGRVALDLIDTNEFDAVILDLLMPDIDGRSFYRELRARGKSAPVLIVSAYGARQAQQELGAQASMSKPFDPEALLRALERLLDQPPRE
jgi:DNA-binding response OmpR family regulator